MARAGSSIELYSSRALNVHEPEPAGACAHAGRYGPTVEAVRREDNHQVMQYALSSPLRTRHGPSFAHSWPSSLRFSRSDERHRCAPVPLCCCICMDVY